jgi:hypothetical protein
MTTQIRTKNLQLDTDTGLVTMLDFGTHMFGLHTLEGRLTLHAPFFINWPDGSRDLFEPSRPANNPVAHRLLDSLLGAHIIRAVAGVERADLQVAFDNETVFEFRLTGNGPNSWYAENPNGVQFVAEATGELRWWGGADLDDEADGEGDNADEPAFAVEAPEPAPSGASDARVIDLEIGEHIYGITVYGTSVQLETRGGSIYLAGPFTVTDADGEDFTFDPQNLADDSVAGALLAVLIDHRVDSYILNPDTSELSVTLTGGGGLTWKASSPAQAQFSAKLRNGREFWSKGDGTIYWYGGPEGTQPKFLVGGPSKSD